MHLYLLRHATATPVEESPEDFCRPLVAKGLDQIARVGRFCREQHLAPDIVLTSPVLRARQTAEAMTRLARWPAPQLESWLACGMRAEAALEQLGAWSAFDKLALVGHEPDLSLLAAHLLASHGGALKLRKASLTAFSVTGLHPGGATLEFLLPCRLMRG